MLTTDLALSALTDAFNLSGIDTPEKVAAFVQIAALQVLKNTQAFELQKLQQSQSAVLVEQQAAREAKQAEINATETALLALVAAQAS